MARVRIFASTPHRHAIRARRGRPTRGDPGVLVCAQPVATSTGRSRARLKVLHGGSISKNHPPSLRYSNLPPRTGCAPVHERSLAHGSSVPAPDRRATIIFSVPLRTRGTECGPDRWVTLPAIISYMEHCRWLWMESPRLGLLDAVHAGHGFYVVSQSIAMDRRFGMGQNAEVRCALTHAGRSAAEGLQDVVRADGVRLAHCRIRGAWMGPTGRLARLPLKVRESVYTGRWDGVRGEPAPGITESLFHPPEPLRPAGLDLALPDDRPTEVHRHPIIVRASDIDIFDHVNAANYVRFVSSALAVRGCSPSIHRAELKYSGQARRGDALDVLTWDLGDNRHAADIVRADEVLFRAVVQTEARDG